MPGSAKSPTVLVVDDDPSLRLLCRVNLELDGFRVVEAQSIGEAEAALQSEPVDVMLLDVHVGQASGLDLLGSLHGLDRSPAVVLVTGSAEVDEETRSKADGVVVKPFQLEELRATVRRLAGS
jgi:two-component system phosphate regulon response regulator PhoB